MSVTTRWWSVVLFVVASLLPTQSFAQGEDHGSGQGDLFGDLVHIKRDPTTGQPILQKRWIEYPGDVLDWGYCPIPIDSQGNEIPFVSLACDPDPAYTDSLVEVDYFGRLSGGRTRERNIRMHFDEVITKIKDAQLLNRDAAGRLMIGTCTVTGGVVDPATCTWKTVDAPQENLALYYRLMKYGHIQTDPLEVDVDFHGDPAQGTQYHVALGPADYSKFQGALSALLPVAPSAAASCFGGTSFTCDDPLALTNEDFVIAASFLGGAADKTGRITPDLLQYLNRILRITVATTYAAATLRTVPALIRDCGPDPTSPLPPAQCTIAPAPSGLPAPADERFVDYAVIQYDRAVWFGGTVDVIKPAGVETWVLAKGVAIAPYLAFRNPGQQAGSQIVGFTNAGSDSLRAVEFMHNYEPPADLGWDFGDTPPPAPVSLSGLTSDLASPQNIGTTVTFTATATGGVAPLQYKWWIRSGGDWQVAKDWSTSPNFVWTPTVAANPYYIGVWVRSGDSTADAPASADTFQSVSFTIVIASPIRVVSLVSNLTAPQVSGTTVTFTATASGGVAPYQYKWWIFNGVTWAIANDWTSSNTFAWVPTIANPAYRVGVWVRSAGSVLDTPESSSSSVSIPFAITAAAAITATSLTPDKAAPQIAGTTVVFTATASGGIAPYEYLFWIFDGATWQIGRPWSSDPTFAWTPYVSNMGYYIGVWVRSAGSTQDTTPETPTSYLSVPYPITLNPTISTNNLSVPAIFAEGYGLTGYPTAIDSGLLPTSATSTLSNTITGVTATWDATDVFSKGQVAYYPQRTSSRWQAEWRNGLPAGEPVVVDWSDKILKERWTPESTIPVETTLYQQPSGSPDAMNAYRMAYLFGEGPTEVWGTDSTTFASTYRSVFAATARLTIERISTPGGNVVTTVPRFDTSAAAGFARTTRPYGSVDVTGRLTYRYDWSPKQWPIPDADKAGWWRLTFTVDPQASYQLKARDGTTTMNVVTRNTAFAASDPGDVGADVTFRPRLVDPYTSIVEVELTPAAESVR